MADIWNKPGTEAFWTSPYGRNLLFLGLNTAAAGSVVYKGASGPVQGQIGKTYNVGTTPPASPTDGMIWLYQGSGFYWQFVYDSTETTYKWKFIGGPPSVSMDFTDRSGAFTANAWGQPYTPNPSLTNPIAGVYNIEGGCSIRPATGGATVWIGMQIGGANPAVDGAWTAGGYMPVASARQNLHIRGQGTLASVSTNNALVYENTVTQNLARNNAYVMLTPIKVG